MQRDKNKNQDIINLLSKYGLPTTSFYFDLEYNWIFTESSIDIKAILNSVAIITLRDGHLYYEFHNSESLSKEFNTSHSIEGIINSIREIEDVIVTVKNFQSILYLTVMFKKEYIASPKQFNFLEKLLITRRHNLTIEIKKLLKSKHSGFVTSIAIDYLINQPLMSGLELGENRARVEKRKRISTSKATITILRKIEKDPVKLKILCDIRKLWDTYLK